MKRIIVLPEELQVICDRLEAMEKALKKEQFDVKDPVLGTEDVMAMLKVSRRCLQTWRDEGLIAFSAVKGKFYYRLSAVNQMLDDHLQKKGGKDENPNVRAWLKAAEAWSIMKKPHLDWAGKCGKIAGEY